MEESTTREKVLKKIRAALLNKSADPYPRLDRSGAVFSQNDDDPVVIFSDNLVESGGKFILCENELEFVEGLLNLSEQYKWKNIYCGEEGLSNLLTECEFPHQFEPDLSSMEVAVTTCECLVARHGSVVVSSVQNGNTIPVYAPVHVVCARSSQIAMEIKDALYWLKLKYAKMPASISFISGPSKMPATGDSQGAALGSTQLYIFLIDDKDRGYIEAAPEETSTEE